MSHRSDSHLIVDNSFKTFTMVEVLVSVAIIAILAAILLPALSRAREKGQRSLCQSNLKQTAIAFKMYSDEFEQMFPCGMGWRDITYTSGQDPFPGTTNEWNGNLTWNVALATYMGYKVTICPSDKDMNCMSKLNGAVGSTMDTYRPFYVYRFGSDPISSSAPDSYAEASNVWPMSYGSNSYLGPYAAENQNGINQDDNVVSPEKTFVLTEVGGETGGYGVNYTYFGFSSATRWVSGRRHYKARGRNFSFVDGHVEHHNDATYSTVSSDIRPAYAGIGITDLPTENP